MTMQILLRAGSNFVLASDTKFYAAEPTDGNTPDQLVDPFNSEKVNFPSRHPHIAITEAGCEFLSSAISTALLERLNNQEKLPTDFLALLYDVTKAVTSNSKYSSERAVLLVVNPIWNDGLTWKIMVDLQRPSHSEPVKIHPIKASAIAGHEHNVGIFWKQYLLRKLERPRPTLKQLEMIAATVILACSFINPEGISGMEEFGFEMWTWDEDHWIYRREEYLNKLKEKYERMEQSVMDIFKEKLMAD